jgi:hypothetical protein
LIKAIVIQFACLNSCAIAGKPERIQVYKKLILLMIMRFPIFAYAGIAFQNPALKGTQQLVFFVHAQKEMENF